jgi:hypothetical protein
MTSFKTCFTLVLVDGPYSTMLLLMTSELMLIGNF